MNWQVVKDLVAYGREQEKLHNKKFRFTLTKRTVFFSMMKLWSSVIKKWEMLFSVWTDVKKFMII